MKKIISFILSMALFVSLFNIGAVLPVVADGEQITVSQALEGYKRVFLSHFKTSAGNTKAISALAGGTAISNPVSSRFYGTVGVEGADSYILDKSYLDFDVNLAESTTAPSIMLFEKEDWKDYLRLTFNNTAGTMSLDYISSYTESNITRYNNSFSLVNFGRSSSNEFFNIKIRADFSTNSIDPTKRDATFKIWINNIFADEVSLLGEDMRNGMFIRPGGETLYLREPKYLDAELEGYKRVDMFDYDKTVGADGVVSFLSNDNADSYITNFDKTYLDLDLFYGESNTGQLQYQGFSKNHACFYMCFPSVTKFRLGAYKDYFDNKITETLVTVNISDYGISKSAYFNIKLRTDIVDNGSSDSVAVQLWIENKIAYEGTVTFNYDESDHSKGQIWTTQPMSVKSPADINSILSGYKRITAEDFYSIGGTSSSSWGRDFASAKLGEYKGDTEELRRSYFDVDIKTTQNGSDNPFMVWPSKNKTKTSFYGDNEQIRFYLSGKTLKLMKVHNGANAGTETLGDISQAPYNHSSEKFFNLKIRTNYYGANSIGFVIFVNNNLLKKVQITPYDAAIMTDMTCAGFRGKSDGVTYARTPALQTVISDSLPVFDSDTNIKTVRYSGAVSNGTLQNLDYYIEDVSDTVVTEYTISGSQISANSATVLALAATDTVIGGEKSFFGLCMTPESGWKISLYDKDMTNIYDYGTSEIYPDTETDSVSDADYTVTAKTENGLLSLWLNETLILKNYEHETYTNCIPKAAVYCDTSSVSVRVETWCDIDNYNYLGDFTGDRQIDIRDYVRMKQVAANVSGISPVSDYVKAFNDSGSIEASELIIMADYLLGKTATLESNNIRLISPRNGTLTALPSNAVDTVAADYDYTAYAAEQFRELHKDQYFRSVTVLKWKCFDVATEYTVSLGTDQSLSDPLTYSVNSSKLELNNLLPDTTYYWSVTSDTSKISSVFSFKTADTIRTLTIGGVSNTRDIGGYDTGNNCRIKYGMVFRGGKLDGISESSKSIVLNDLGVHTDLDLRGLGGTSPLGNTVNYYSYSAPYYWNDTRGINATGDYRTALVYSIRVFANPANYPIYTHCSLGRDRTGSLILLISGLCGVGKSDIYLDYELSFLSEIGTTNDHTTPSMVGNHFTEMYNQIQNYAPSGTFADACEAFMLSIGITQSEIDSIRATLKESK